MNIIGSLVAQRMTREDYVFTDIIDTHAHPDVDQVAFQFAIGPMSPETGVDVQQFCGNDGVNFDSMGDGLSFSPDNCANGVFGSLPGSLKSSGERYVKFGFNCNGDAVNVLLFGAVVVR
jgi:hypothetical protein